MKKLILLLLIPIFFTCSSDSDSDYSILGAWTAENFTVMGEDVFVTTVYSYVNLTFFQNNSFTIYIGLDDGNEVDVSGYDAYYDRAENIIIMTYDNGNQEIWEVTYIDGDELSVRIVDGSDITIIDWVRI